MTAEQARKESNSPNTGIAIVYSLIGEVAYKATSCYVSELLMLLHQDQLRKDGYKFDKVVTGCITVLISWSK